MIYDDVARHLGEAGSFERAALPLGVYLAWCANHRLLSEDLCRNAGELVTRVRYRDVSGSELAVAGCGGVLSDEHLDPEGRTFTESHYPAYLEQLRSEVGGSLETVQDEWALYDRLAPWLTRRLMDARGAAGGRRPSSGRRRWWQLWK